MISIRYPEIQKKYVTNVTEMENISIDKPGILKCRKHGK